LLITSVQFLSWDGQWVARGLLMSTAQFLRWITVDFSGGQHEYWLKCLRASQLERTSLVLLHCSSWQSIELKVGWWYGYQWWVWSSELQQKWLSVWTVERCIGDHTDTHSHNLMTKWQSHLDTYVKHDWMKVQVTRITLVIDHSWSRQCLHDSECDSMCECDSCFPGEHIKHIWSKYFEHNQKMVASMI